MKEILDSINEKLSEVSSLKHIDENWGQLDYFEPNFPVQWPCALTDFNTGQFSNTGLNYRMTPQNRQEGTLTIEVTVANVKLTNSSTKAPVSQKNTAFKIWDIVNEVHNVLQGFAPLGNEHGKMIRSSFQKVRRDDGVQEIRVIYSIGLHDC